MRHTKVLLLLVVVVLPLHVNVEVSPIYGTLFSYMGVQRGYGVSSNCQTNHCHLPMIVCYVSFIQVSYSILFYLFCQTSGAVQYRSLNFGTITNHTFLKCLFIVFIVVVFHTKQSSANGQLTAN